MLVITTDYRNQGAGVVGKAFDTEREAEMLLEMRGWERSATNKGKWEKDGPTRMMGQVGICITEYVYIEEV